MKIITQNFKKIIKFLIKHQKRKIRIFLKIKQKLKQFFSDRHIINLLGACIIFSGISGITLMHKINIYVISYQHIINNRND